MEEQNHGVVFESRIILAHTGVTKDEYQSKLKSAYTASMDIQKGILSDKNYSVKACKEAKKIYCGDALRFYAHCRDDDFTIIMGAWKQTSKTMKTFYQIIEVDISKDKFSELWSDVEESALENFVNYVKSIPSGKQGQLDNKSKWKKLRDELYKDNQGLIRIDAKIDSKSQRRVQCSIGVSDLLKNFEHRVFSSDYKGIRLPYEQASGSRQF